MDELIFGKQSLSDEHSLLHWWQKKLESRLQTLLNAVKVFSYSRTDTNALVVETLADEVDQLLNDYEHEFCDSPEVGTEDYLDRLVLIETHQLLAQARQLIGCPKNYGFKNVVELYPGAMRFPRADILDEEFEAQLAASDVPLLLKDESANGPYLESSLDSGSASVLTNSQNKGVAHLTVVKTGSSRTSNVLTLDKSRHFSAEGFSTVSPCEVSEHPTDPNL